MLPSDLKKLEWARSSASVFLEALTDEIDEDPRVWKPLVSPRLVEIQLMPLFCMVVILSKPEELHQYAAEREYIRAWTDNIVRGLIWIGTHVNVDLWGTVELRATGPIISFEPTDGVGVCGNTVGQAEISDFEGRVELRICWFGKEYWRQISAGFAISELKKSEQSVY